LTARKFSYQRAEIGKGKRQGQYKKTARA